MLLLAMIFTIIVCVCVYLHFTSDKRLIAKIPGPRAWPLVGNSWSYVLSPEELFSFLRVLPKKYGGINQVHAINMKAINIYDPEDIEKVISTTRFNAKQIPYNFMRPWLCDGLLVSNGEKWQQRRKLLTRAFHFNILKKYMETFAEQAEVFLELIAQEKGKTTNILPLVSQTALRIICETAMGTTVKGSRTTSIERYFDAVHKYGQIITNRICRVWYYFDLTFMFSTFYNIQRELVTILQNFTASVIEAKKEESVNNKIKETEITDDNEVYGFKGRLGMLDLLLEYEKEGIIDVVGIREEVDTFMFEGHDTIAMGISYFIMSIANEPEIQDKIYEEMYSIFGDSGRIPTMEDLNEMKYLECCIKESLRLYPSVPFIARYLTEEVTLSGHKVPPGTVCQIHVFDLHRCERIYPQPEKFIPERFMPQNSSLRHPYAYIPFSAGPRNCIGQKFAMLEMKSLISGMLRKFRLKPVTKPEDLVFKSDLVLRTTKPIYVRFCAREFDLIKS